MPALLSRDDIPTAAEYEQTRDQYRRQILVQKQPRRVLIGTNCSVHFENREIMRYQVLEMLRAEGTFANSDAIEDELHAYNPLITQPGTLCATLMFEYPTEEERQEHLTALVGIDRHVWFQVGDTPKIPGQFDAGQIDVHKVSSVQFIKFALTDEQQKLITTSGTVLKLVIDHPHYPGVAVLGEETRKAISQDLSA